MWHSEELLHGCDDKKSCGRLCVENKARSHRGGSDNKPRYKTNDHETEPRLIVLAVCVWKGPDSVCHGSVMITDCGLIIALLRRFSWHWFRWPWPVCVCLSQTCQISHASARCMCVNQGWPFSARGHVCASSAAGGESPCLLCESTSLWEFPIKDTLVFWLCFITSWPHLWLHSQII